MANIGSATLLIVPKFDNLSGSVSKALGGASAGAGRTGEGLGEKTGKGLGKGLLSSGAAIGAFSAITSKAMQVAGDHVGAAVTRFDTLNNYPRVMENLGYSADKSKASISKMSDRLQTLPTTLDSMVGTVQGIVAVTGDLDKATDAGLALNDMLVASGSNTQVTNSAMEQFRQILAKGKPDMQDWRSLTSAMPGQMDQLAKSMLGPKANANDLYKALGGGGGEATISMDQLLDAMIRLDTEGGDSITSFKQQAEDAAGGIQTQVANLSNAVTRGLSDVLGAIGSDTIGEVLGGVKQVVRDLFGGVTEGVTLVMPAVKGIIDLIATFGPQLEVAAVGAFGLSKAFKVATGVGPTLEKLSYSVLRIGDSLGSGVINDAAFGISEISKFGPQIAIGAAAVALLAVGMKQVAAERKSTKGLADAIQGVSKATANAVDKATVAGDTFDKAWARAKDSIDKAREAHQNYVKVAGDAADAIGEATAKYGEQNDALEYAGTVIDTYAGKSDLTASQQDQLKQAIDQVNDSCGTQYKITGENNEILDENTGKIQDNTDEIWNNIRAREAQNKADLIGTAKTETEKVGAAAATQWQAESKAAKDCSDAYELARQKYGSYSEIMKQGTVEEREAAGAWQQSGAKVKEYDQKLHAAAVSTANLNAEQAALTKQAQGGELSMGELAATTQVAMEAFNTGGSKAKYSIDNFGAALDSCAKDHDKLTKAMQDPATMAKIVDAYDGTAGSLKGVMEELGIGWDEAGEKALEAQDQAQAMENFLGSLPDTAYAAFGEMGVTTDQLMAKLKDAGVSTGVLNAIGSENFANLAASAGGNLDTLIWMIDNYNDVPIVDKEGNVDVNDASLVTAEGTVVHWNGETWVNDKNAKVDVNKTSLTDAQGNVYTWNGSKLVSKSATAKASGNATDGSAKNEVNKTSSSITNLKGKAVNVKASVSGEDKVSSLAKALASIPTQIHTWVTSHIKKKGDAAGGIRPHADGGIVRRHADGGAIVNNPGPGIPLDIVGEAGAEAIVPLTNKRYTKPFADTLADGIAERMGGGTTYNLIIDGAKVNDHGAIKEDFMQLMYDLHRLGAMTSA